VIEQSKTIILAFWSSGDKTKFFGLEIKKGWSD
jgi:hypothetical protein